MMKITDEKIKELKKLLWILDSKHNISIPQTQENINYIADAIVKLLSIPDVIQQRELLIAVFEKMNRPQITMLEIGDYDELADELLSI